MRLSYVSMSRYYLVIKTCPVRRTKDAWPTLCHASDMLRQRPSIRIYVRRVVWPIECVS